MSCVNYELPYIASDLGGYVVCAPYFNSLMVAPLGFEPRPRGLEPLVLDHYTIGQYVGVLPLTT
jgi:hypothetical protein